MAGASEWFRKKLAKYGIYPTKQKEHWCGRCKEQAECPAYNTGVIYPCPYYKEEMAYGTEKHD